MGAIYYFEPFIFENHHKGGDVQTRIIFLGKKKSFFWWNMANGIQITTSTLEIMMP